MTRIAHLRILTLASGLLMMTTAQAQMSDHRFNRMFDEAFGELMAGDLTTAQGSFEHLHRHRPENSHVSYLLALTLVQQGRDHERAVTLLGNASGHFSPEHRHGNPEATSVPGNVFLLLGDALHATGQHDKAVNAYRTYMTTISMASIHRKSEVIQRIRDAREAMTANTLRGSHLLAELQLSNR